MPRQLSPGRCSAPARSGWTPIWFTLIRQVFPSPPTPSTVACGRSFPRSAPLSRATRVTSEANPRNWSTMVWMVFFNSRISPFTSTPILRERSPFATAVVTSAIFLTWEVRLLPSWLRVCQVFPGAAYACYFRLATQFAFRSYLDVPPRYLGGKGVQLVDHRVDRFFQLEDFSFYVHRDFTERSPLATAVVTSAIFRTWPVRYWPSGSRAVRSFHTPPTPTTVACPPSLPSEPTSRATRVTSEAKDVRYGSTIVLMVFFSSRISPRTSTVILREGSPSRPGGYPRRCCGPGLWVGHWFTVRRSFHTPSTPGTRPVHPVSRPTSPRATSDPNEFNWSTMVLMVFSIQILLLRPR